MRTPTRIIVHIINFVFSLAIFALLLRLLLKLFAANPGTPFVAWAYETSQPLLYPFANMFPSPVFEGGVIIEFSTLFAVVAYLILQYLIVEFILFLDDATRHHDRHHKTLV